MPNALIGRLGNTSPELKLTLSIWTKIAQDADSFKYAEAFFEQLLKNAPRLSLNIART